jgi:hypothetical protein
MSEHHPAEQNSAFNHPEEMTTALFAQLILQQSNMALMLLGKVPHPESGQTYKDLEAARLFIDQLEMLETKTKGNLTKEESGLLKQTLMNLRLAFVEAVESSPQPAKSSADTKPASAPAQPAEPGSSTATGSSPAAEEEHRKKFSKKY